MFCRICGTQLADDAMFCLNCGNKVKEDEPSYSQPVEQAPSFGQPVQQAPSFGQPVEQPSYYQQGFQQDFGMGIAQTVYQQPVYQNKVSGNAGSSKAKPWAIIFGILACLLALAVSVDSFMGGEIGVGIENIAISICSIIIISYAVSKGKGTGIAKGIAVIAVTALHIAFFGVSAFKAVFDIFGNAKAGTDYYYAVILLIELVFFYLYMLINIIKSFTNSDKPSGFMLFAAYISALLTFAAFVIDWVSDVKGIFAFKYIPVDLGLIFMILADIFAVFSRTKKK